LKGEGGTRLFVFNHPRPARPAKNQRLIIAKTDWPSRRRRSAMWCLERPVSSGLRH